MLKTGNSSSETAPSLPDKVYTLFNKNETTKSYSFSITYKIFVIKWKTFIPLLKQVIPPKLKTFSAIKSKLWKMNHDIKLNQNLNAIKVKWIDYIHNYGAQNKWFSRPTGAITNPKQTPKVKQAVVEVFRAVTYSESTNTTHLKYSTTSKSPAYKTLLR